MCQRVIKKRLSFSLDVSLYMLPVNAVCLNSADITFEATEENWSNILKVSKTLYWCVFISLEIIYFLIFTNRNLFLNNTYNSSSIYIIFLQAIFPVGAYLAQQILSLLRSFSDAGLRALTLNHKKENETWCNVPCEHSVKVCQNFQHIRIHILRMPLIVEVTL